MFSWNCWGWWVTEAVTGVGPQVRSLPSHLHPYPYRPRSAFSRQEPHLTYNDKENSKSSSNWQHAKCCACFIAGNEKWPTFTHSTNGYRGPTRDSSRHKGHINGKKKKKTPPPKKPSPMSSWNSHTLPLLLLHTPCTKAPKAF